VCVREGGIEVSFCILLVDSLQEKLKDGHRRTTQKNSLRRLMFLQGQN